MDDLQRPDRAQPPVIALPDELDHANAGLIAEQIRLAFAPGVAVVIADMTGTKRCDSWGVHVLALAHRRAAASHAELWLAVPSPVLRHTLALLGIMLPVYPSLSAALARANGGRT